MASAKQPAAEAKQPAAEAAVFEAATCLYHATEAPAGRVFQEGQAHPGAGWVDTPAGFKPADGDE